MTKKITLLVACLLLGYALIVHTAFQMLAAGVAIFLFGMLFMEQGFRALTGGVLEKVLAWSTDRFGKSMAFGLITTALMQSSSLVTVITISTLSASLITLAAGIGIVFGANIGTTTGAWLMAYGMKISISTYAMPMIVIGLIREGAVTPEMATSLMNDSAAALHISKRLHAIGEYLAAAQAQAPRAKDG